MEADRNIATLLGSRRFIPHESPRQTEWLVDGLFAQGHLCIVAALPSCGKSFFVEALATAVIHDKPFLNRDTRGGDVLLIDEDTPTNTLDDRLSKFYRHYPANSAPYTLFRHSMEHLSMDDRSMAEVVNGYENLRLLIIDCLVSAAGRSDLDKTSDVRFIDNFKAAVHRNDMTIIINHHISTKANLSPDYAMTCQNPQALLMNNTRIVSASDTVYVLSSPDNDGVLKTLFVRPVARRAMIPTKPFSASLVETGNAMCFEYGESLKLASALNENEARALALFKVGEQLTVKSALAAAGQYFSDKTMREVLHSLEDKGYLHFSAREGSGGRLIYTRII